VALVSVTSLPYWSPAADGYGLDVTSRSELWRGLSPMLLGPVMLYNGMWSANMENAWQYAKVYPGYEDPAAYWPWASAGWAGHWAVRYPMGKNAVPLHSLWGGEKLGYITARQRIYIPLYTQAVRFYAGALLAALRNQHARTGELVLRDFDGYDHRALGYTWADVINNPTRKMGHGHVLAMMIEGVL
jgi:hypothetical protein